MSKWIKKGDKVVVIAGNDKGKTGEVLSRTEDRIMIQGVNIRKKHAKRKTKTGTSEILEMERPIHISNVSFCTPDGQAVRLRVRESTKGGKELFYVDGDKEVAYRQVKTSVKG